MSDARSQSRTLRSFLLELLVFLSVLLATALVHTWVVT